MESNRIYGLSEQIAATGGAIAKGPIAGVGLGVGSRLVKKYGDSIAASSANRIGQILDKNPKALGAFSKPLLWAAGRSPQQFASAVNSMMKKPEFKKKLMEIEKSEGFTPVLGDENRPSGREPSGDR
jgi:hypothetical protein